MRTVTATEPESYSVVLAPTVLESFADLNSETYYEVRRVIDSLQVNPQPPDATPALEGKRAETELRIAAHPSIMISYSVDDENRQVMVEEITNLRFAMPQTDAGTALLRRNGQSSTTLICSRKLGSETANRYQNLRGVMDKLQFNPGLQALRQTSISAQVRAT